jgi:hypothetical protein
LYFKAVLADSYRTTTATAGVDLLALLLDVIVFQGFDETEEIGEYPKAPQAGVYQLRFIFAIAIRYDLVGKHI